MPAPVSPKPRRCINQLAAGDILEDQVFLIHAKDLRSTSNGSLYIHCVLADRTGQILGRIWQATDAMYRGMPDGGFLRFKGRVENYKGSLQFIVDAMQPADAATIDPADFMPTTTEDIPAMFERVKTILREIKDPHLLQLMKAFVLDEELMARFRKAPAAVQMHHAFIGGLLEHTRNVLELARLVIPRYPEVSLDLVLAGVFLHDIGKTAELVYDTNFVYSNEGQLLGHIVQATLWVEQKCKQIEQETDQPFPVEIKTALQHIIIAHHGQYDFGSPKIPATPEAIAIHHLDNLDAKLNTYLTRIRTDPDPVSDWTPYISTLGTKLYKKDVMRTRAPKD